MKKSFVHTLGCRLNHYESDYIETYLKKNDIENVCVINTCAVTKESVRKSKQFIRRFKSQFPSYRVYATGCAAQLSSSKIRDLNLAGIIDNKSKNQQEYLDKIFNSKKNNTSLIKCIHSRSRQYIKIQDGCNHSCTFCIIPHTRGSARSLPENDILRVIKKYDRLNVAEIVLTGVDISSWGLDLHPKKCLGDLVESITNSITNIQSIRISSIDVQEIDQKLFHIITTHKKVAPYLHLSLQSGNNLILKRMKRRHQREDAISFCQEIIKKNPRMGLGADIIVGFPTETDEMFRDTLDMIIRCQLKFLHIFPFSSHQEVPSSRMPQVPCTLIKERTQILKRYAMYAKRNFFHEHIGKKYWAIVEQKGIARLGDFSPIKIANHTSLGERKKICAYITGYTNDYLHGVAL